MVFFIRPKLFYTTSYAQPIATDVCLCVRHTMSCAKTGEPIEMPFGDCMTLVGPKNHVLNVVEISTGMSNFGIYPTNSKAMAASASAFAAKRIIQSLITTRHEMRPIVKIL